MAHIIVKDRRLALADRHLVTDADGAPCCCDVGAQFIRAKDCCSNVAAWFPTGALQCAADIGVVFSYQLKCWSITGPTLTETQIKEQYPQERIYTPGPASMPCRTGCNDPLCPSCAGCCYVSTDAECPTNSPLQCFCVRGPCACGKRWIVNFRYTMHTEDNFCDGRVCVHLDTLIQGAAEWFYDEPAPGQCELKLIAVTGTARVSKLSSGPCAAQDYDVTENLADMFPPSGGVFPFRGCGESPLFILEKCALIAASLAPSGNLHQCQQAGCGTWDGATCSFYDEIACTDQHSGCVTQVGGHSGCFSGALNYRRRTFCQGDCGVAGLLCDETETHTVTVLDPCPPDKDIDTLGGGVEAPPPTAGSLL